MKLSKSYRIGIDVRLLTRRRGIGNYVYNFLQELAKLESQNKFILYADSKDVTYAIPNDSRFILKVIGPKFYPLWEQIVLPIHAIRDNLDILHCPANAGPLLLSSKIRLILTIHDVMYMLPSSALPSSPSLYQNIGRKYLSWIVPLAVKDAAALITVSNYSKTDIIKYFTIDENKIFVIHEAAGKNFKKNMDGITLPVIENLNIPDRFIMAFGAIDPRKNTSRIIDAFEHFINLTKSDHQLIVVGLPQSEKNHFTKQVQKLGISSNVTFLGFVSEDELIALYNRAEIMLYPSLYEGFGVPILEAMACGTPVIGSTSASIPEIAGNAAVLIDPTNLEQLYSSIHKLSSNKKLRDELSSKGFIQANKFSWSKLAVETLSVYNGCFKSN
jgi:glycosyltransferase involved in cell wall biosynthesis